MPTSLAILSDVDLRYRNTYTQAQKLVWFNEEMRELFDVLELDSPPYTFTTVVDQNLYPFPDQFDVTKIKTVSYQTNSTSNFNDIPYMRNDDQQYAPYGSAWYTIVSNSLFLYDGDTVPAGRTVYVYCDLEPTEVTTSNVSSAPDLPTKYQEILKLGLLKRIAGTRKDIQMRNNYDMEYQQKIDDVLWQRKLSEPELVSPNDVLPRAGRGYRYGTMAILTTTE